MLIRVTIQAVLELPEGTTVPENGRAFTLPDGNWVKPFVVLEYNDLEDLNFEQLAALGCDVTEEDVSWEEI